MTVIKRNVRPDQTTSVVDNVAVWADNIADKIKDSGIPITDVGLNFSFQTVEASRTITIPLYEQMTVHGTINIEGTLIVEGQLVIEI